MSFIIRITELLFRPDSVCRSSICRMPECRQSTAVCKLTRSCDRELRSISMPFDKYCTEWKPYHLGVTYKRAQLSRWSVPVDVWRMKQHHHLSSMREILPANNFNSRIRIYRAANATLRDDPGPCSKSVRTCSRPLEVSIVQSPSYLDGTQVRVAAFCSTNVFRPPAAILRAGEFNIKR